MISAEGIVNNVKVSFEVDNVASSSYGVIAKANGTAVLCTTAIGEETNLNFKPLSVNYVEKFYAINKIPGGFKKRESGSDQEILISRVIDRSLRPLVLKFFSKEVQVFVQVLSYDGYSLESLSVSAASLSLNLAGVINDTVALGKVYNGEGNTGDSQSINAAKFLHSVSNDKTIMVEYEGIEVDSDSSKELLESSYKATHAIANSMSLIQNEFLQNYKKVKVSNVKANVGFFEKAKAYFLSKQYFNAISCFNAKEAKSILKSIDEKSYDYKVIFKEYVSNFYLNFVFKSKKRLDGRSFSKCRDIKVQKNIFDNSVLFERGKTQALVSLTEGASENSQLVENLYGVYKDKFLCHYNLLPHAAGEIKKSQSISRREIGHGELAKKSLKASLVSLNNTIRINSDITSCDGSTSMSTVTAASIALKKHKLSKFNIAGISVGLAKHKDQLAYLVDLVQSEDAHLSLVDCKVSGSKEFITAIQLEAEKGTVNWNIFLNLINLAHEKVKETLNSIYAPKRTIVTKKQLSESMFKKSMKINPHKIHLLLGVKGAVINSISKKHAVKIDVKKDGSVYVFSKNRENIKNAFEHIKSIIG